ncbi:lyase family protein [Xylophilus sp.]|uniref:lyase family protein n=1 Tax=Xylophilus sp. TaxID=2653893 RepID=UPI0013BA4A00|nr:lyase family protein [Xylophilus sp.]KAF1049980.1 MAG: 3-carboxy-cis,cis-muconate cycloisomerase [Xylophilus sp.]
MSIFDAFLCDAPARDLFDDHAFVAAMLRFESALAQAQAAEGLVPGAAADVIARVCSDTSRFDPTAIARASSRAGSVAIPLVQALKAAVAAEEPAAQPYVHWGSTSQDVIDSAMALVSRAALDGLLADLQAAATSTLDLSERHAGQPMLGRTLLQPGSVTSFGWKCAGWAAPLVRSWCGLRAAGDAALQVQLGGAVGTLAQMQEHGRNKGPAVARRMAQSLGLAAPQAPWHTQRDRWVALGCELGILAGSLGKIARDVALMGQFELGEVAEPAEPGRGGSSAMPHKRNPVGSMVAIAAATSAPQLVATLLSAMPQEHERALGAWQAELAAWPALVVCVAGSVHAMAQVLAGLTVQGERMRANVEAVRRALPPQAADEWFASSLAGNAAALTHTQVARLRTALATGRFTHKDTHDH